MKNKNFLDEQNRWKQYYLVSLLISLPGSFLWSLGGRIFISTYQLNFWYNFAIFVPLGLLNLYGSGLIAWYLMRKIYDKNIR